MVVRVKTRCNEILRDFLACHFMGDIKIVNNMFLSCFIEVFFLEIRGYV